MLIISFPTTSREVIEHQTMWTSVWFLEIWEHTALENYSLVTLEKYCIGNILPRLLWKVWDIRNITPYENRALETKDFGNIGQWEPMFD